MFLRFLLFSLELTFPFSSYCCHIDSICTAWMRNQISVLIEFFLAYELLVSLEEFNSNFYLLFTNLLQGIWEQNHKYCPYNFRSCPNPNWYVRYSSLIFIYDISINENRNNTNLKAFFLKAHEWFMETTLCFWPHWSAWNLKQNQAVYSQQKHHGQSDSTFTNSVEPYFY